MHFNSLLKTQFILKYISEVELRRSILISLNRGEAYNNLYKAITVLKKGEFRGASEIEMEIWNQCTRLISSVILYYNSYVLNELYKNARSEADKAYLLSLSPSAWVNINLLGYYQFCGTGNYDLITKWIRQWDWRKSTEPC